MTTPAARLSSTVSDEQSARSQPGSYRCLVFLPTCDQNPVIVLPVAGLPTDLPVDISILSGKDSQTVLLSESNKLISLTVNAGQFKATTIRAASGNHVV